MPELDQVAQMEQIEETMKGSQEGAEEQAPVTEEQTPAGAGEDVQTIAVEGQEEQTPAVEGRQEGEAEVSPTPAEEDKGEEEIATVDYAPFLTSILSKPPQQPLQPVAPVQPAPVPQQPVAPPVQPVAPVQQVGQQAPILIPVVPAVPWVADEAALEQAQTPAGLNMLLQRVYDQAITAAENKAFERVGVELLPAITKEIQFHTMVNRETENYFHKNRDLNNPILTDAVVRGVELVQAAHPDWNLRQLLEESGNQVRRAARGQIKVRGKQRPTFATKTTGRGGRITQEKPTAFDQQFDELLKVAPKEMTTAAKTRP